MINIGNKIILSQFKLLLHAGEAKSVAPLSAVLGQFGLNCPEFCQRFNDLSLIEYVEGTPLIIDFFVLTEKKFDFVILKVAFNKLLRSQVKIHNGRRAVNKLRLFKFYNILKSQGLSVRFSTVIGSLRSIKIRKII
jgi:ribosomal protein L11